MSGVGVPESVDPTCFDKMYGEDNTSPQGMKRKRDDPEASPTEGDRTKSMRPSNPPPSAPSGYVAHSISSDDAAIEAAIAVALQLACHTTSAEQILQVLYCNPPFHPSSL